jgi:hypothetical protein
MTVLDASLSDKPRVKPESLFVLVHALRVFTRPRGESQVYRIATLVISVGMSLVKVRERHYSGLFSEEQDEDSSACIAIHPPLPALPKVYNQLNLRPDVSEVNSHHLR